MELEEIIERCKNGEQQAQSWLYRKYSRKMLRICRRFVTDPQIAQDLMHDGFILIFASIRSLQQPEKVENWMGRIMTNLALKYIRQTRSAAIISLSDLPEEQQPIDEETMPETLPLETLLMMIEKLPEGYRNVFKLSVLDGLSHKEIAKLLHIAPHSSSSQFYRAKEYLKKMILQHHYQLLILIILLMPICYLLFWKDTQKGCFPQPVAVVKETIRNTAVMKSDNLLPTYKRNLFVRKLWQKLFRLLRIRLPHPRKSFLQIQRSLHSLYTAQRQKTFHKYIKNNQGKASVLFLFTN